MLQDEYKSYNWSHVNIDPVKNKVKTENIKAKENIKTDQYSRGEEDAHKTIKNVSFKKQENQVEQDHHEDMDKNVIRALKNLDTSYNPASINQITDKFNGMTQKTCHKKSHL